MSSQATIIVIINILIDPESRGKKMKSRPLNFLCSYLFVKESACLAIQENAENRTALPTSSISWIEQKCSLKLCKRPRHCSAHTIVPALPRTFLVCFTVDVPVYSHTI